MVVRTSWSISRDAFAEATWAHQNFASAHRTGAQPASVSHLGQRRPATGNQHDDRSLIRLAAIHSDRSNMLAAEISNLKKESHCKCYQHALMALRGGSVPLAMPGFLWTDRQLTRTTHDMSVCHSKAPMSCNQLNHIKQRHRQCAAGTRSRVCDGSRHNAAWLDALLFAT